MRPPLGELDWRDIGGVVIGGGDDVDPKLYRQEPQVTAKLDPARDELELALIRGALDRHLPLLGICRGAQLINVVLGGTLYADLRAVFPLHSRRRQLFAKKRIDVADGSTLLRALRVRTLRVNSLHGQGVAELGDGLVVSARDYLGVVQAVERPGAPFCLGIQWHPELLLTHRAQRRIFRALVKAARAPAARGKPSD